MRLICWLRRDLRLTDNTALDYAARTCDGDVVPVFILDPAILNDGYVGPAITAVTLEMLRALDQALRQRGSELIIRHGDPLSELKALLQESQADGVVWNRDYTPFAVRRDTAIKRWLKHHKRVARSFPDAVLVEPEGLLTKSAGNPYATYGPYARRWSELAFAQIERVTPAPQQLAPVPASVTRQPLPTLAELGFTLTQTLPPASEDAAQQLLQQFFDRRRALSAVTYATARELPAQPGTSDLSMHLRMGTLSPRQCLKAAADALAAPLTASERQGVDTWISELAWRDFYNQLTFHFPHVLKGPYDKRYAAIQWRNQPDEFAAWCGGLTGYPIVDAGQRQLNQIAWMHNRVRMISASFLVKHLLIDWRWGERYFMQQLRDGDPTANNGGWQWAAGCGGPSAQPYFRVLNPITQSQKHDPSGDYIRRYVPELRHVPNSFIHTPWLMTAQQQQQFNCRIGVDYPAPLIEHSAARARALDTYRAALQPDK